MAKDKKSKLTIQAQEINVDNNKEHDDNNEQTEVVEKIDYSNNSESSYYKNEIEQMIANKIK